MLHNALGRVAVGRGRSGGARILTAETGVFTLTGQDATLTYVRNLSVTAEAGSFTLTGQDSTRVLSIQGNAGAFALTGNAATLRAGRILYATPDVSGSSNTARSFLTSALGRIALGSGGGGVSTTALTTFELRGQPADFVRGTLLDAATGSFVLTFNDASLDYASQPSNIRAFPRVGRGPRGFGRGGQPVAAKAGGGGFRARNYGG